MIVVDTSALLAVLLLEPDAAAYATAIAAEPDRMMSTVSLLEASLVLASKRGASAVRELDEIVKAAPIRAVPFAADHVAIARDAFMRFGKGRHPAGLNFGDCASYALAKALDARLLFKGDDFSRTDITPAALP